MSVRALYGLTKSAERFRTMLVDPLHTLGFIPSCIDRDVHVRLWDPKDGFDFICTFVYGFKVVAKDPAIWITYIASGFLIKENSSRQYCLVNDHRYHGDQEMWTYIINTYTKDAVETYTL